MTLQQSWPDHFDIRTDSVFEEQIKPFILTQLEQLKAYDAGRPQDITYIFHQHADRVSIDMRETCRHLGLSDAVCENMYWAMLPHDIGKQMLPTNVWDSEEKPTGEIKQMRRTHTDLGAQIVNEAFPTLEHPFLDLMLDIMLNHHEQMDGTGYRGLSGDQLSAPVRLACIIESFDGYQIWRPHFGDRDTTIPGVLKRMREEKGADFYDMDLFEAFATVKMQQFKRQQKQDGTTHG